MYKMMGDRLVMVHTQRNDMSIVSYRNELNELIYHTVPSNTLTPTKRKTKKVK